MRMKNNGAALLAAAMVLGLLVTGCGASSKGAATSSQAAMDQAVYEDVGYTAGDVSFRNEAASEEVAEVTAQDAGTADIPKVQDSQRKLIKNVDLEVETEAFDGLLETVERKTESLGGYVEARYSYYGSSRNEYNNKNANLTIRIPAEKLNEFLSDVSENGNIISQNESVTDVTLQYVDMESHKKALQSEQERLLELLDQAETVEDIITIESRLSEVRYQIESMESQLRTMDNQVSYSTVYLYIKEVARLTNVAEQTTWEKMKTGFADSLYHVGKGLKEFGIGFVIRIPYLVVWAVVLGVIALLVRLILKGKKKRALKEQQKKEAKQQKEKENTDQESE